MQDLIETDFDSATLLGSHLGLSMLLPVGYNQLSEFTLNQFLNVFPNEAINEMPKLRYVGVGISGCYNIDDGFRSAAFATRRTNMGLYHPIPIRCRPIDEDLSPEERALYRIRQRKVLSNGEECFLYYLKVLNMGTEIKFKRINPVTGQEESYELDRANLQPEPIKTGTDKTLKGDSAQVVAYCEASTKITAEEILEYITREFKGDVRYGKISELGFYTGVDKVVSGLTGQNVGIQYTEAINTHLYNHMTWTGTPLDRAGAFINGTWDICSDGAITYK